MAQESEQTPVLIHAARVFDGNSFKTNTSVLVTSGIVTKIDSREALKSSTAKVIDLGDATLLPGFIELHAHIGFQHVPADIVLKHGITTIRDIGGPLHKPYGGDGSLRVLTSGPIITAPGGYPIMELGSENIAIAVSTERQARETVRALINGGAAVIKVALEPGGEAGSPWASEHHHTDAGQDHPHSKKNRPLLPENIVRAIVDDAQELMEMMRTTDMHAIDVLRSATSESGSHLNIPLLGTLQSGAPADMIAVKGDPVHAFKILEYPDFVMSGGKIVVNNF